MLVRSIRSQKEQNTYLNRFIWIGMDDCMRDELNGRLNVNIRFKPFLRGMNGCVCLRHDLCSKV